MINSLRGIVTEKGNLWICVENQGMEWQLIASSLTVSSLPAAGEEVRIFTWLYHKDDQMALYGFMDKKERALFLDLISVSGLGPKGAVKILSSVNPDQLILYLEEENLGALASLPGLGKKTAQKILLHLKGKLSWADNPSGASPGGAGEEWIESLAAMGFDKRQVQTVLKALLADNELASLPADQKEQEILRRAIVKLSS